MGGSNIENDNHAGKHQRAPLGRAAENKWLMVNMAGERLTAVCALLVLS